MCDVREKISSYKKHGKRLVADKMQIFTKVDLLVSDGNFFPTADTAVAKTLPRSAITVNVNGIPINANIMQNVRPPLVTGTMFPYPFSDVKYGKKR